MGEMGTIERFLAAMGGFDWESLGACVTEDLRRVGPYGDVVEGREAYVRFIADLLPTLPGYRMDVHRVGYVSPELGVAELTETVDTDDGVLPTDEALVFDLAEGGRIRHIAVYFQQSTARG